jgi:ribosomal RNA-processing protein 36
VIFQTLQLPLVVLPGRGFLFCKMPSNPKNDNRSFSERSGDEEVYSSDESVDDDEVVSLSREARRIQAHDSSSSSSSDEESIHDNDDSDNDTSDEDDDDDEESASGDESSTMMQPEERALSLPLSERLKRDAEKGVNMKQRRERQRAVLHTVTDRLQKEKQPSALVKLNKKKSKHAPTEASSKRPSRQNIFDLNESGLGISIGEHRYKPRDPRKSSLHGRINAEQFDKNYAFLKEIREKEIEKLKLQIRARKMTGPKGQERRKRLGITKDGRTVEDDHAELKKLSQEKSDWERQMIAIQAEKTVQQQLKSKPYHPKRKEYKKMLNIAKFDEIRKRGGDAAIAKVIAKRRKKNKSKDANLLGGIGGRPGR